MLNCAAAKYLRILDLQGRGLLFIPNPSYYCHSKALLTPHRLVRLEHLWTRSLTYLTSRGCPHQHLWNAQDPARRVRSQGGIDYEYMAATICPGPTPPNDGSVWQETSLSPIKEGEPSTMPNGMVITTTVKVRPRILCHKV